MEMCKLVGGVFMKVIKFLCFSCGSLVSLFHPIDAFAGLSNEAGGLTLVNSEDIEVLSQDLYLSFELVKSSYIFKNSGKNDIITDVKLALPWVDLFPGVDYSKPDDFHFFYNDVEIYPSFSTLKVDENGGACIEGKYSCIEQITYFWSHRFRVNKEVKITLQYKPGAGVDFGGIDDTEDDNEYCIKDDFLPALKKRYSDGYDFWYDEYLEYSPANNLGKIGSFRLVVDKGKADNLVSFCGDNVKKISPTQFEIRKTNFIPPKTIKVRWATRFSKQSDKY